MAPLLQCGMVMDGRWLWHGGIAASFGLSLLLGAALPASATPAGEPLPIEELREYPERYHLHNVVVQGTAQDVRAFDPYKLQSGSVCYAAYSFRLVDGTGMLPVIVMGVCGVPIVKDPDIDDGDVLSAEVTVHAPGKGTFFLTFDGRSMPFTDVDDVQGVARNIWTISKSAVPPDSFDQDPSTPAQSPSR